MNEVQQLLLKNENVVIIFPFHLHPNAKQSIQKSFPKMICDNITEGAKIKNKDYSIWYSHSFYSLEKK